MHAGAARDLAARWVEGQAPALSGLCAAHLVGGLVSLPLDAMVSPASDVDLHLIFEPGSPALSSSDPFGAPLEVQYEGLPLEAGLKSRGEYASPEAVLANPEIAYHLTRDCVLYDPIGLLARLQPAVQQQYAVRHWVVARVEHERQGMTQALAMRPQVQAMGGTASAFGLLGYAATFAMLAPSIAALKPLRVGSRLPLHLQETLAEYDRLDLYEALLDLLGVRTVTPATVEQRLAEGLRAFDQAVAVHRTPVPFGHKFQAHLRPYFSESCHGMLQEGHHREAMCWLLPYYLTGAAILLTDGSDSEKRATGVRLGEFLASLGVENETAVDRKYGQAATVYGELFALANDIIARQSAIREA
jgi:hypothetical protein